LGAQWAALTAGAEAPAAARRRSRPKLGLLDLVWAPVWPWGKREVCAIHWSGRQGLRGMEQGARRGAAALGRRRAVPGLRRGSRATTTRAKERGGPGGAHRGLGEADLRGAGNRRRGPGGARTKLGGGVEAGALRAPGWHGSTPRLSCGKDTGSGGLRGHWRREIAVAVLTGGGDPGRGMRRRWWFGRGAVGEM